MNAGETRNSGRSGAFQLNDEVSTIDRRRPVSGDAVAASITCRASYPSQKVGRASAYPRMTSMNSRSPHPKSRLARRCRTMARGPAGRAPCPLSSRERGRSVPGDPSQQPQERSPGVTVGCPGRPMAVAITTALSMNCRLAQSLIEIEHRCSGLVDSIRTDLHKIRGPRVSGRSHGGAPHGALYHDMLSAIQST